MKFLVFLSMIVGAWASQAGAAPDVEATAEEICLNGDNWSFQPVRLPFYGYELDAPGRWQPSQRSHEFIVKAISDPGNDWERKHPVRIPMSWSSVMSDPGSREALGDFDFPWFWQYVHKGIYEREFSVPESFRGRRIKLAFESVNFRCWVYVNDTLVGGGDAAGSTHENKHPFELDVTDYVRAPSAGNRLRVIVHDFTASFEGAFPNEDHPVTGGTYPLSDRCDYYNKDRGWRNLDSGILGDVLLRAVPVVNVKDVFVRTSVKKSAIEADITVRNEDTTTRTVRVSARATEWKGGQTVLAFDEAPSLTLAPGETRSVTLRQPWPKPRLWWPHDPVLHQLVVELADDTRRVASHAERFGFREVEMVSSDDVDRRGFYLNGVRVRLFGESVEPTWKDGYTEGVGTSGLYLYNPEYWSFTVAEAKRLNMTVLRPHRGMWLKRMFEIADEMGMMMIAESTVNNGNHKGGIGTLANQRRAIGDMITSLRNHPSIVIWSLANETPYNEEWADEAKRHDRTRPYVATQTVPRNHPSPSLAAATDSYAMGLSGYEPNIYRRHHSNWVQKPLYIYEDNACYDEPGDAERVGAVQNGLTKFRGHRSSGYEIVCTFYTWQKLYGQPQEPAEKHLKIDWTAEETGSRGYRPAFARMPLLDPWTDRAKPRVIRPLTGFAESPDAFWQRSYSPVAVFDCDHDQRLDINANPYIGLLAPERVLTIHNDDLLDRATTVHVTWTVTDAGGNDVISTGAFDVDVPLGGMRQRVIRIHSGDHEAVRVTYTAAKSGRERFRETIHLGDKASGGTGEVAATTGGGEVIVMNAVGPGVDSRGYKKGTFAGSLAPKVLIAEAATDADYVRFNPVVTVAGNYNVYVHVPPGLSGTQGIEIQHDTINTIVALDLARSGWIRVNAVPLYMHAGALQNAVTAGKGGTTRHSVVDTLKLVLVK